MHSKLASCQLASTITERRRRSVEDWGKKSLGTYIKDDQVEEDHESMNDEANNVLELADHSLGVLQSEGQMLAFLHIKDTPADGRGAFMNLTGA